jgi:hypothetical protein
MAFFIGPRPQMQGTMLRDRKVLLETEDIKGSYLWSVVAGKNFGEYFFVSHLYNLEIMKTVRILKNEW